MKGKRDKLPLLRWRGLLADRSVPSRMLVLGVLLLLVVALTFTQVGMLHLLVGGDRDVYVVYLLVPMVLAAAALGTFWSLVTGLFSGAMMALHAVVQPLGYYEAVVISPGTALILFGTSGLLLGLLTVLALRRDPRGWRRYARMAGVCVAVSAFFSVAFFLVALTSITIRLVMDSSITSAHEGYPRILASVMRMGDCALQLGFDAAIMVLFYAAFDWLRGHVWLPANRQHLQRTFKLWLLLVVSVGFLLTVTVSFVMVTQQELTEAQTSLGERIESLKRRMDMQEERVRLFDSAAKDWHDQAAKESYDRFLDSFGLAAITSGYSADADGTILVMDGVDTSSTIVSSNDTDYEVGSELGAYFDQEMVECIARSAREGTLERLVIDSFDEERDEISVATDMSYVLAQNRDDKTIVVIESAESLFADRDNNVLWITYASLVLLTFVFLLVTKLLDRLVIKPIGKANGELQSICEGNLETVVDARGSLEMGSLSEGINATVETLRGWIVVAKDQLDQELTTAKAIQSSALPSTFPPFPDIHEFDIYASMDAARMVGGDFYDFFLVDDHTLGFLIADVSGKGIPGALFMMAAKAELDNYMQTGMDLAEAIKTANFRLCEGNDAGMFVTVWAATLDYHTGVLTYVNAGHNPPLLRHDGVWTWLKQKGGLFMGTFEKAKYRSHELTLAPGDELLLYTDGVNEAFNVNEEEYGNDRLEEFLSVHTDLHPRQLVGELRKSVATWAEGAEQSDDITIVSLEYGKAPNATGALTVPATLEHLDEVVGFINEELARRLCSFGAQRKVDMVLEELFVNICKYAYADCEEPGTCRVEYLYKGNPSTIAVSLIDEGVAFNPLDRPQNENPLDAVENGGLGILLARNNADDMAYLRDGDCNVLTFTKSW